ncbi:MAG: hypothetical protein BGN88_08520 [Clostridiales bacterium 43-6]|nr:MAG: hypothetical protein BGN88_08520 [Clostridiales bacterium 43-6]
MITNPSVHDIPVLKRIWKEVFGDIDEYIDLFFREKFTVENTLVYKENDTIVSMIFFPCYEIKIGTLKEKSGYICGAATLKAYRGQGIMGKLLEHSFAVMQGLGYACTVLIPANEGLYRYYQKFGYETVFYKKEMVYHPAEDMEATIGFIKTEDAFDILPFYQRLIAGIEVVVLQNTATYQTVFEDYKTAGGEVLLTDDGEGYLFVLRGTDTLYVKEFFYTKNIRSILGALFLRYPQYQTIVVNEPENGCGEKSRELLKTGMLKILTKTVGIDRTQWTTYMNMMLN